MAGRMGFYDFDWVTCELLSTFDIKHPIFRYHYGCDDQINTNYKGNRRQNRYMNEVLLSSYVNYIFIDGFCSSAIIVGFPVLNRYFSKIQLIRIDEIPNNNIFPDPLFAGYNGHGGL